jgi:acyl carrier protein
MGLDTVDLIYKIEKHFILPIPDQEAEKMETIRDIRNYIINLSNANSDSVIEIEKELLALISDHAGVDIKELWLDMSITNDLGLD